MTNLKNKLVWLKEPDKFALQCSLKDLDIAYQNFFRRVKHSYKKAGFPKFKSKKDNKKSYKTKFTNNNIQVLDKQIKLSKLGLVKCKVSKQISGRIFNATISQNSSGKYFVSVCCTDVEIPQYPSTSAVIGIDLGIKEFATTSNKTLNILLNQKRNLLNFKGNYQEKQLVAQIGTKQELKWQENMRILAIRDEIFFKNYQHN